MGSQRVGHDWVTSLSLLLEHSGIVVIQSLSHVQLYETPWTTASQSSLSFTISRRLLKLMSIESVKASNHLILCHPLLLLPSIFPRIRDFSNELAVCISLPKYGTPTSVSVFPKKIQDWFPLGLTGLISLQFMRFSRVFSNITVQKYQFLSAQLSLWSNSHPYMTVGKSQLWLAFVSKVMSLLF